MGKSFTPKDCHQLMNLLVRQGTGQADISVVDTSSFVSAGELLIATGYENVFNTINLVYGRLIIASRSYKARLTLMDSINSEEFSNLIRKISFYSKGAKPSGNFNTDLYTNLADGFTNGQNKDSNNTPQSTKSQWEQNQQPSVTTSFGGRDVWDNCITLYENQVQVAFRDESEFAKFTAGYIQEHANDIESQREAWNRMCLLNRIAQTYDMRQYMEGSAIDVTAGFNTKYGTSYTSAQLRTTYLSEFTKYFVSLFKTTLGFLNERSTKYHWPMPKTINGTEYNVLRHTDNSDARVYMYTPLWADVESHVLPEIFNPEFLDIKTQYQPVTFWQNNDSDANRPKISVEPAIVDADTTSQTYGQQIKGAKVDLDYVVGMITDKDGLLTDFQIESTRTTPVEARKGYRNTWQNIAKNCICDPTEKCVIFYMSDASLSPNT